MQALVEGEETPETQLVVLASLALHRRDAGDLDGHVIPGLRPFMSIS
jgi:hypothetical protein